MHELAVMAQSIDEMKVNIACIKQKKKIAPISSMHTTTPYAIPTMC